MGQGVGDRELLVFVSGRMLSLECDFLGEGGVAAGLAEHALLDLKDFLVETKAVVGCHRD